MSLYIGGSVNVFADLEDCEAFDKLSKKMNKMSKKYDLSVDRQSYNDGQDLAFIIHNRKEESYDCLYAGDFFEYDLSIPDDPTFDERLEKFLIEFKKDERFKVFHKLEFNESGKRYFVIS